jgi:hypothetical protein
MRKLTRFIASLAVVGLAMAPLLRPSALAQESQSPLTMRADDGSSIHIFPTVDGATTLAPLLVDTGPLDYHGGPVMLNATTYAIFWVPAKLQNGAATGMSATYRPILKRMLSDYPGHGIDNNNTQYFQTTSTTTYIHNTGQFGGAFVDTSPYPASKCTDSLRLGNCLTDAQLRREIKKVMALKGWTGGFNHIFLLFTSDGEGSCIDSTSTACAYTLYCGYHSAIVSGVPAPIIYANEPYGDLSVCQLPSIPSPNGDAVADAAASTASHEVTESITDPFASAWFTSQGNEIGDLCAYTYGPYTWGSSNANEMWNGDMYVLQMEFDNHLGGCVPVGP